MDCTVLVTNLTGGQGKTMSSQIINIGFLDAGRRPRLAAADTFGDDRTSKLGRLHPGLVEELGIGVRLTDIRDDAGAAIRYWDRFGQVLLRGGYIVDVGANVAPFIFDWAYARNAGRILRQQKAPPIILVVPMRPQAKAVEDALNILERSINDPDMLPISRRVLIQNESGGTFANFGSNEDYLRLEHLTLHHGLRIARMRHCHSDLWPIAERLYIPILDLLDADLEVLQRDYGLDLFAASGAQADLVAWLNETLTEFREIGLVPPPAEPPKVNGRRS